MEPGTVKKSSNRSIAKYLIFIFILAILSILNTYSSLKPALVTIKSFDIFDSLAVSTKYTDADNDDSEKNVIKKEKSDDRKGKLEDGEMEDTQFVTSPTRVSEEVDTPTTSVIEDKTDERKLNILVLYPDDWRWNAIGRENSVIQTPFLDSLGDDGMRFRKNCVTSSICWLSRG